MVITKSAHQNLTLPEMFYFTSVAFERDAQRVSRQFLRSLSGFPEKTKSRK
jgi:hypothetical protein